MFKSIFTVVVVVAVAIAFCVGCSETPDEPNEPITPTDSIPIVPPDSIPDSTINPPNTTNKLVGDWSVLEMQYNYYDNDDDVDIQTIPDDYKMFFSFKSSNGIVGTHFRKISDFWIESIQGVGRYSIKGDSVCVIEDGEEEYCRNYNISGDTLTLIGGWLNCYDDGNGEECHAYAPTIKAVKDNLATFKSSLGNNIKSQDPALISTVWERPSSNPECEQCENDRIGFWSEGFSDHADVYISDDAYDAAWYTDGGNRLTLVVLKCDRYEEECVSTSVDGTVTLDYELTNGTLRLKAAGMDWDTWTTWTRDNGMYKSKAKAKSKKDRRAVNPLFKVSRK